MVEMIASIGRWSFLEGVCDRIEMSSDSRRIFSRF